MKERTPPRAETISTRVRLISEAMETLRIQRGLSRRQLALASGVHPTQMSQILLGHQGMSIDRAADILGVLGATLVVSPVDERTPHRLGEVDASGRVIAETALALPAYLECREPFGDHPASTQLFIRELADFQRDRLMLVELGTGLELRLGVEESKMRFLRNAASDDLRYVPERHRVLGLVYGAFRPM
jgi:transcriptional regulator with XRE-family HTH domain